jgi:hypothetical protein
MKKASQLDWTDLQEIAKMKGVGELVAAVPAPASTDPCPSESEREPAAHTPVRQAAQVSDGATPEKQTLPNCSARSDSPEKDLDMI